jgi:hypothetical protein
MAALNDCRLFGSPNDYSSTQPALRVHSEDVMKYLCLVYIDQSKSDALSKSEFEDLLNKTAAYNEELKFSGHSIMCSVLQAPSTAAIVRVGSGGASVTDGPFAESKEQLGGFILINARDLNDAIRLAAKLPPARIGCIEVRPVQEFDFN